MDVEPDSTTAEREYSVDDDVLCYLTPTSGDAQFYLGSVVQINRQLKRCLVKFLDETETWCDFADMKFFGAAETEAEVTCVTCKSSQPKLGSQLVVCACGRGYHQRCHQPVIPARDPNWRCRICCPKRSERMKPPAPSQVSQDHEQCMACGAQDPWYRGMVQCRRCSLWVHGKCMHPSNKVIQGDRFYVFICSGCNSGKELCCRLALTWTDVIHLVLYDLNHKFHVKYHDLDTSILPHLSTIWPHLHAPAEIERVRQSEWRDCVESTLRSNSKVFRSGREAKKRTSLWGLKVRSAPRPPRITLPPHGQVDPSLISGKIVLPEKPLQNGHVNSSRKGEESDSGRSCSPPGPEIIVESSTEFHGLGLVKRSVPFPVADTCSAAGARFRSQAVRRAARMLRQKNRPVKPKKSPIIVKPSLRLSDSEDEALRTISPGIKTYLTPAPKTQVRKRPQRNLLEARLNSTESKLYNATATTAAAPAESPGKKKKEGKEVKKELNPKRKLVQKTLLETFRRAGAGDESGSSADEKIRAVLTTRKLSAKDVIIRNGVVVRRRRPRRVLILPHRLRTQLPPEPPPPPATTSDSLRSDWRELLFGGPVDLDKVRHALGPFARMEKGEPYVVTATRTLPNGEVEAQIEFPADYS